MRLNLGCGKKLLDGYLNVDFAAGEGIDLVHDCREPLPFAPGAVEEIYSCHFIEHLSPAEWERVRADWVRCLAPGGRLVIECPDCLKAMEAFVTDKMGLRWKWWRIVLWGEPDLPGFAHKQGFTIGRLREELEAAGLEITRARNFHHDADPDNLILQYNLRIEAVKPCA